MAKTWRRSRDFKRYRDGTQPPRCYEAPCDWCFPMVNYNRNAERHWAIRDATYDPEGRCQVCGGWVDYHLGPCWKENLAPHCAGCWEPNDFCCCGASEELNYYGGVGSVRQSLADNDQLRGLKYDLTASKPFTKKELRFIHAWIRNK